MMRTSLLVALVAGCGRIGFDPGSAGDAGGDDSVTGDTLSGFCATVTPGWVVCTDFDTGQITDGGWTSTEKQKGTVAPDTTLVESAPRSLATLVGNQTTAAESSYAGLDYAIANAKYVEVHTSLYLPQRPSVPYEVDAVNVTAPGVGQFFNDIQINASGPDLYREEYVDTNSQFFGMTHNIPQITTGTWHHVVMTLDLTAATYRLDLDGSNVSSGNCMYPIVPGSIQIEVGAVYVFGVISNVGLYHDNVVVYAQ